MKATLIKANNHYYLEQIPSKGIGAAVLEGMMGSTDGEGYYKLSKQNCDEIFGVVDVEKLASEVYEDDWDDKGRNLGRTLQYAFEEGFNKAMELNKYKQFTLSDMKRAFNCGRDSESIDRFEDWRTFTHFIDSLQRMEIEVEIEMKKVVDERKTVGAVKGVYGSGHKIKTYKSVPKLDTDGCLILKKAE